MISFTISIIRFCVNYLSSEDMMVQSQNQTTFIVLLSTCQGMSLEYSRGREWVRLRTVARKFSTGGLCVCGGGLTFKNFTKSSLIYSASCFNLGEAWDFFGGLGPPKQPPWRRDRSGFSNCWRSAIIFDLIKVWPRLKTTLQFASDAHGKSMTHVLLWMAN